MITAKAAAVWRKRMPAHIFTKIKMADGNTSVSHFLIKKPNLFSWRLGKHSVSALAPPAWRPALSDGLLFLYLQGLARLPALGIGGLISVRWRKLRHLAL